MTRAFCTKLSIFTQGTVWIEVLRRPSLFARKVRTERVYFAPDAWIDILIWLPFEWAQVVTTCVTKVFDQNGGHQIDASVTVTSSRKMPDGEHYVHKTRASMQRLTKATLDTRHSL